MFIKIFSPAMPLPPSSKVLALVYFSCLVGLTNASPGEKKFAFLDSLETGISRYWRPHQELLITVQNAPYLLVPIENRLISLDSARPAPDFDHPYNILGEGRGVSVQNDIEIAGIWRRENQWHFISNRCQSFTNSGAKTADIRCKWGWWQVFHHPEFTINRPYLGRAVTTESGDVVFRASMPMELREKGMSGKKDPMQEPIGTFYKATYAQDGSIQKLNPYAQPVGFPEIYSKDPDLLYTTYFHPMFINGDKQLLVSHEVSGEISIYDVVDGKLSKRFFIPSENEFNPTPPSYSDYLENYLTSIQFDQYGPVYRSGRDSNRIYRLFTRAISPAELAALPGIPFAELQAKRKTYLQVIDLVSRQTQKPTFSLVFWLCTSLKEPCLGHS